jgi:hypothetical protein
MEKRSADITMSGLKRDTHQRKFVFRINAVSLQRKSIVEGTP